MDNKSLHTFIGNVIKRYIDQCRALGFKPVPIDVITMLDEALAGSDSVEFHFTEEGCLITVLNQVYCLTPEMTLA